MLRRFKKKQKNYYLKLKYEITWRNRSIYLSLTLLKSFKIFSPTILSNSGWYDLIPKDNEQIITWNIILDNNIKGKTKNIYKKWQYINRLKLIKLNLIITINKVNHSNN